MWPSSSDRRPLGARNPAKWLRAGSGMEHHVRDGLDGLAWKWTSPRQRWTDVVDFVLPQLQPNLGASAGLSFRTEGQVLVRQMEDTNLGRYLAWGGSFSFSRCTLPPKGRRAGGQEGRRGAFHSVLPIHYKGLTTDARAIPSLFLPWSGCLRYHLPPPGLRVYLRIIPPRPHPRPSPSLSHLQTHNSSLFFTLRQPYERVAPDVLLMSSPRPTSENAARAVPVSDLEPCRSSEALLEAAPGAHVASGTCAAAGLDHDHDDDYAARLGRRDQPPGLIAAAAAPTSSNTTPTPSAAVSPFMPPPSSSADKVPDKVPDCVPDYVPRGDANARDTVQGPVAPVDGHAPGASSNKKARGPGSLPRQSGPSLLTQALASARGITNPKSSRLSPQSTSTSTTTTATISPTTVTSPSYSPITTLPTTVRSSKSGHKTATSPANTSTPTIPAPHSTASPIFDDPLTESANSTSRPDRDSAAIFIDPFHQNVSAKCAAPRPLTRATSESSNMAASTVTTMTSLAAREAASVPSSFSHSALATFRDVIADSREARDVPRGRASTSLDLDRSTIDYYQPRTTTYTTSFNDSPSPFEDDSPGTKIPPATSRREDATKSDQRPAPWAKIPPHWTAMGSEKTEKIWSIGSVQGQEEDGLVEKSITEAMAGVEPNARSRKSSYSLRFFKEGLPSEDKSRRREPRHTPKEKLAPTLEEDHELSSNAKPHAAPSKESTAIRLRHDDGGVPLLTPKTPYPYSEYVLDEQPIVSTSPHEDYFSLPVNGPPTSGCKTPLRVQQSASRPVNGHEEGKSVETVELVGPTPDAGADSEAERVEARRKSGDSVNTEVGSHDDGDADESGEEKISSAVFLPHQELQEPCIGEPQDRTTARNLQVRSLSQSKQHPWLVKADEPEPEIIQGKDDPPYGLARLPSRERLAVKRSDLGPDKFEDGAVIEEDPTVTTDAPLKTPQAVSQYEDHMHDHQHDPQEPLEAIELIPYKHQVGGHTTLWRFSRRAVCKQLNNRENEFYETIERYHRDLLPFLPRYVPPHLSFPD